MEGAALELLTHLQLHTPNLQHATKRLPNDQFHQLLMSRSHCRCKEANYCSKECQQTHWTVHKKICRQIAEIKGFVPPSRTEVLTGAEAAAAGLSTAGAGPSEDELRIAWAIAAAREADGGSSSSSDDWKSASFSGLPHDMAGKQVALYKACCTRRPAVNLARPDSNSNARGALASVDEASDDDKAALPSSTSTAVDAAAAEGGQGDAIVNLVSALLSSGCKADPPDSMGVPLHGAATAGESDCNYDECANRTYRHR